MFRTANLSVAHRFAGIIGGLRLAVAAAAGRDRAAAPLLLLVWTRLGRMAARFTSAIARPHKSPPRAGSRRPTAPDPAVSTRSVPYCRLPTRRRWLFALAPATTCGASSLERLLADPEMAALLRAVPELGRVLRPLGKLLDVDPALLPTPPRRCRAPAPTPEAAGLPNDGAPLEAPPRMSAATNRPHTDWMDANADAPPTTHHPPTRRRPRIRFRVSRPGLPAAAFASR